MVFCLLSAALQPCVHAPYSCINAACVSYTGMSDCDAMIQSGASVDSFPCTTISYQPKGGYIIVLSL